MYASTEARVRKQQWDFLRDRRRDWGPLWVMGGDFNDIKNNDEKKRENDKLDSSFQDFRDFIYSRHRDGRY